MTQRARHIPVRSTIDGKKKGRRLLLLLVALLCVFGLILCGGFRLYDHEERSGLAMDDCRKSLSLLTYQRQTYEVLIGGARVRDAAALTASETTDPQTVARLKESLKESPGKGKECKVGASPAYLKDAVAFNARISRWYRSHARRIDDEVAAVKKSHQDKVLQDSRADLSRILAEARRVYSSSDGKVADESTRATLKKCMDEAGKDGTSKDPVRLRSDVAGLRKAIDGVAASVQAKTAAEAKAKSKAGADSRDPSQQAGGDQGVSADQGKSSGGRNAPGKRRRGSGQGRSHPAPSSPARPAPAPAPKPGPSPGPRPSPGQPKPQPEPSPNPPAPGGGEGGGDDDDDPWPGHGWPGWPPSLRHPWPPRHPYPWPPRYPWPLRYPWPHD